MLKSSEVYSINNSDPKILPWSTPETTLTVALTLPLKRTRCLLSLRNSDTMNKNCPSTPIHLSLYNRPCWLILSNAAVKCNWTSLPSTPLFKASCRWWDNVSNASHVPRPLLYGNWEGGISLLLSKKWVDFPATGFSNTVDWRGVIEIGHWSPTSEEESFFGTGTTSANLQHAWKLAPFNQVPKNYTQLRASSRTN